MARLCGTPRILTAPENRNVTAIRMISTWFTTTSAFRIQRVDPDSCRQCGSQDGVAGLNAGATPVRSPGPRQPSAHANRGRWVCLSHLRATLFPGSRTIGRQHDELIVGDGAHISHVGLPITVVDRRLAG